MAIITASDWLRRGLRILGSKDGVHESLYFRLILGYITGRLEKLYPFLVNMEFTIDGA